jgi:hypothetical protein
VAGGDGGHGELVAGGRGDGDFGGGDVGMGANKVLVSSYVLPTEWTYCSFVFRGR